MEIVVILGRRALWLTPYPDEEERKALIRMVWAYLNETMGPMGRKQRLGMVVINGAEQQVILLDFTQDTLAQVEQKLAGIKAPLEAAASIRGGFYCGIKGYCEENGERIGRHEEAGSGETD